MIAEIVVWVFFFFFFSILCVIYITKAIKEICSSVTSWHSSSVENLMGSGALNPTYFHSSLYPKS